MIVSMTGFGDASAERSGTHYSVEIRSLNNRFFKSVIKLPDNVSGLEPEIETLLREGLGRGSITYILKMRTDSAEAAYHINTPALTAYLEQLQQIRGLGTTVSIDLASLVQLPGVCQEPRDETDEIARHGDVIRELTSVAITKLAAMRTREGQSLMTDLLKHSKLIASDLAEIQKRAPTVIDDYHRKLTQRVNLLLSKAELQVSQADLLKEIAVFAERADISEEIQRLDQPSRGVRARLPNRRARRPQARFHRPGNAPRSQHHRLQGQRRPDRQAHRRNQGRDRSPQGAGPEHRMNHPDGSTPQTSRPSDHPLRPIRRR